MVNYTTAGMQRFFSPSFDTNPDAFCKAVPNLPGEWVCVRVQRGHFGPFFGWVDVSHVIDETTVADVACLECEGDGTLTAIGPDTASIAPSVTAAVNAKTRTRSVKRQRRGT